MVGVEFPLVTIVTVTYNCEGLIEPTIESVCSQTYPNKEHIIVDGGSDDATVSIINKHRHCISQLVSEKDHGIYDAMNKGIRLASPDSHYITFLNAGDIYVDSDVIQKTISRAKSFCTNLYGNISVHRKVLEAPGKLSQWSLSTNMVCHQACFFLTETHRKFLYDTRYKICADYKLLLELTRAGELFEKIDITVAEMDVSGVSHSERSLLFAEKNAIRKMYPVVYLYAGIKKAFNRLRRMVKDNKQSENLIY
jgi:glycosyltransferase involved in cell wall biosynthesis